MQINENGVIRDLTPEEVAAVEAERASLPPVVPMEERIAADNAAKQSGYQKLIALGLTEAEATALTGYVPQEV